MTQNQIAYHNARELERHNKASELETARHQSMQEALQHQSNMITREGNVIAKEHYERMDAINARHYENQDAYNAAMLQETQRANLANEQLKAQQNAINAAAVSETARHQRISEGIESSLASNTIYRTQKEMSLISPNADLIRAQTNTQYQQAGNLSSQYALNQARLFETQANTGLTKERTKTESVNRWTEKSRGWLNYSTIILNGLNEARQWLNMAFGTGMKQR